MARVHYLGMMMLREIGKQLDLNIFPLVKNGGIVMPNKSVLTHVTTYEDINDERSERQSRSKTKSRERTTRRERETRRQGEACSTTQVISSSLLQAKYMDELPAVKEVYPSLQTWQVEGGMWLLCQSALLPGALHNVVFICAIPFTSLKVARAWGFWNGKAWIGPRHTNMPDGSICAFEPSDGTWKPGDSLINLLDIYTLWAVRHLYLRIFNHWPGAQVAHNAYERLAELKEDELCGCGSTSKRYADCCRPKDLSRNRISDAIRFVLDGGADRKPPERVIRFLNERNNPPPIRII